VLFETPVEESSDRQLAIVSAQCRDLEGEIRTMVAEMRQANEK
jgi:hypothetical protein